MKILFLDFDGVLNSLDYYKRRQELKLELPSSFFQRSVQELDVTKVKLVSDFINEMNLTCVVSSSWRCLHPIEELNEIVAAAGWNAPKFFDITPRTVKGFRGDEVQGWLTNPRLRNVELLEPITHHVILDDDGDFHPDQPLVKTSWEYGLTEDHLDIARGILTA